jgi:hypothetical protein
MCSSINSFTDRSSTAPSASLGTRNWTLLSSSSTSIDLAGEPSVNLVGLPASIDLTRFHQTV